MLKPENATELDRALFAAKIYISNLYSLIEQHSDELTTKLDSDEWVYLKGLAQKANLNIKVAYKIVSKLDYFDVEEKDD